MAVLDAISGANKTHTCANRGAATLRSAVLAGCASGERWHISDVDGNV